MLRGWNYYNGQMLIGFIREDCKLVLLSLCYVALVAKANEFDLRKIMVSCDSVFPVLNCFSL